MPTVEAKHIRILRQVEYYFCDFSLPFDDFLRSKLSAEDESISVDLILGFGKMKHHKATAASVQEALTGSDLVTYNATDHTIKRMYPLPDADPNSACMVHVDGFEVEDITEAGVRAVVEEFGEIESVRLLRNYTLDVRPLNGDAIVTFVSEEAAANAVKAEGKPIRDLAAYMELIKERRESKSGKRKAQGAEDGEKQAKKAKSIPEMSMDYPRGTVVSLGGLAADVTINGVKELCAKFGPPAAWVEQNTEDGSAMVRFKEAETAQAVLKGFSEAEDKAVTAAVLEGDEELAYWKRRHEDMHSRKKNSNNYHKKKRRRSAKNMTKHKPVPFK